MEGETVLDRIVMDDGPFDVVVVVKQIRRVWRVTLAVGEGEPGIICL